MRTEDFDRGHTQWLVKLLQEDANTRKILSSPKGEREGNPSL